MERIGTIILAAGKGTRMQSDVHKQFLLWNGKPLFLHSVEKFLPFSDQVILVTGEEDVETMKAFLSEYHLEEKVPVITGGKERYHSSMNGLSYLKSCGDFSYVVIHDAARPFVTDAVIQDALETVKRCGTAVASVKVKDTIKRADSTGLVLETPNRESLYAVQTPQAFSMDLILKAYENMMASDLTQMSITDDAMVVETFTDHPVQLSAGDYKNSKVTTKEDLVLLNS